MEIETTSEISTEQPAYSILTMKRKEPDEDSPPKNSRRSRPTRSVTLEVIASYYANGVVSDRH